MALATGTLQDNIKSATRTTAIPGQTAIAVVNPDGSTISGGGGGSTSTIMVGTVDGETSGTQRVVVNNKKQQVLLAHDLIESFTWLNFGTKQERVDTIIYTSATFPGVTVTRTFAYTLVGANYRLDSSTWTVNGGG